MAEELEPADPEVAEPDSVEQGAAQQDPAEPDPAEQTKSSLADEVFSDFLVRVQRGESFDPDTMLARVESPVLRDQLRRLIENYQHRVLPRTGSEVRSQAATLLGKFQILGELGRGGMGIVYLAHDKALNRKVALKVLPKSDAQDERVLNRFLREAEASARLRHPNIVPIYLAGEHDGTYYYSMEYVPGITLAELIRALRAQRFSHKGPLTVRQIEEQGEQVLRLVQ